MKILLATGIYPPEIGGPATQTRSLAQALRASGHSVSVITYGEKPAGASADITYVSRRGGACVRYVRYAWHAFNLLRKHDLVYAQGPVSEGLPTTVAAWLVRRPLMLKVVGDYAWEIARQRGAQDELDVFLQRRQRGLIRFYAWAERWTARRARQVIVPSRYLKSVVERWDVPTDRIEIIVNAVQPLPASTGRDEMRQQEGLTDRVVILTAVRAVPWKGIDRMIEWWQDLPVTHILIVAGDGPELASWQQQALKYHLGERVRFLGAVDRITLAAWYRAADAFVLPSTYEGYPNVVAEAASVGLPCVISDQGGNPETREQFGALIRVVAWSDVVAWKQALRDVAMRTQAARHIQPSIWTHAHMVDRIEQKMREVSGEVSSVGVLMLSYERELTHPDSDAVTRVSSLTDEHTSLDVLVLSRFEQDTHVSRGQMLNNLSVSGWRGSGFRRVWRALTEGWRVLRQRPAGSAVITAQDPFVAGVIGYALSRVTNTPLEIQEHADYFSGEWVKESATQRAWSWIGRWILRRAERVRVVSERVREHVVRLGVDERKIELIPVAQELEALFASPAVEPGTWHARPVRVVLPCRFVPQKGLDVALQALKRLKEQSVAVVFNFIGAGPLEDWIRDEAHRLELTHDIRISPWARPADVWPDADLLVVSSRYEGWGRVIVEAMAAGVPVVTTDVGCVGSFFRPGVDGCAVPPNDARALAHAIESAMADPASTGHMLASARARAHSFPARELLHARQRLGWCELVARLRVQTVGPRFDAWVGGLIIFVLAVRLSSAVLFQHSLLNREWGFYTLVRHWFQGYGYSFARQLGCASAYRSPGFLFFLTGLYSVFSPLNTWAQALVQNAIAALAVILLYFVGQRLVGKRAAWVGAFLMAVYPYTFYHYTQFYHTFLSSFFLIALLWCLLRLEETRRWRLAIMSGAMIACLAYVQGTILAATPFIVLWLLRQWWPDWKRVVGVAAVMGMVSAALIAPWTYRNYRVFHRFIPLTTDLGFADFKANNENIAALTRDGYPQEVVDDVLVSSTNSGYVKYRIEPDIAARLQAEGQLRPSVFSTEWHPREPVGDAASCQALGPLNEVDFNDYWLTRAADWTTAHPQEAWRLHALKLKTFWQPALFPSVKTGAPWPFANSPIKVFLARWSVTVAAFIVIFFGWIGILIFMIRRERKVWLPLIILLTYTILHTFFAGYTKYRIPLDNLVALYAGWTLVRMWDRVRGR